ncbi:MAG TPA: hypothetical protein VM492_01835 [Sumerlaeia bacterium]|nr:hypothetical protein [Sumerlaeia bacterium]
MITNNAAALTQARRRMLALEDEVAQLRAAQEELRRLLNER